MPGADDEGIMGDVPQGEGIETDATDDDDAKGLGRTPMPPD